MADSNLMAIHASYDVARKISSSALDYMPSIYRPTGTYAYKILPKTSTKSAAPLQGIMMRLIASQTTIPIPYVNRILITPDGECGFLEMEYIEGVDLYEIWPTASWFTRLKIIWTLRGYIRQLRRVKPPFPEVPGPVSADGEPHPCFGLSGSIDNGIGPFATYNNLAIHFDMMRGIALNHPQVSALPPFRITDYFDTSWPLVFTHGALHLKNLRMGRDGTLWLLDWDWAGMYPLWFESWKLHNDYVAGDAASHYAPRSFTWFYWFMAGWYPRQTRFMDMVLLGSWLSQEPGWRYDQPERKITRMVC